MFQVELISNILLFIRWVFGDNGHRELIICPIDSNCDPSL